MPSAAPLRALEELRTRPLGGAKLAVATAIVWLAGALYCSGYERLLWGAGDWPGSLVWSAVAVLPWLALFEWSKTPAARRIGKSFANLALLLAGTAVASVVLELTADLLTGATSRPIALLLLRRLPAVGTCLVLILWTRAARPSERDEAADESLTAFAGSIDWVGAADNYIELHIRRRVTMRRMTLRAAERELAPHGFVRIHRRYLVNKDRIRTVQLNGRNSVELVNGEELPVGRAYMPNVATAGWEFATSPQKD